MLFLPTFIFFEAEGAIHPSTTILLCTQKCYGVLLVLISSTHKPEERTGRQSIAGKGQTLILTPMEQS